MKIQSISSILNDPKSDSFYKQVKNFVTQKVVSDYKATTEMQYNETSGLQNYTLNDFRPYI